MNENLNNFSAFASNQYSQFGEDGIIGKILELMPESDHWCVEFGAWDGIFLSNTYHLIKNKNFKSVLIEASSKKFKVLQKNMASFPATLINEFVTFEGKNTLDQILARTKIPKNFDFLSIDIDGNDYYVLESLKVYRPKIICIEFNPSMPNEVEFVQAKDFSVKQGASPLSILKLAQSKGYVLAATTFCNLILVDQIYGAKLGLRNSELAHFRNDQDCKVFAFSGYDGSIILSKPLSLPWHGISIPERKLQFLPKLIRNFPGDYCFIRKSLFGLFLFLTDRSLLIKKVKHRFLK